MYDRDPGVWHSNLKALAFTARDAFSFADWVNHFWVTAQNLVFLLVSLQHQPKRPQPLQLPLLGGFANSGPSQKGPEASLMEQVFGFELPEAYRVRSTHTRLGERIGCSCCLGEENPAIRDTRTFCLGLRVGAEDRHTEIVLFDSGQTSGTNHLVCCFQVAHIKEPGWKAWPSLGSA